jgi:hypothetical protein
MAKAKKEFELYGKKDSSKEEKAESKKVEAAEVAKAKQKTKKGK